MLAGKAGPVENRRPDLENVTDLAVGPVDAILDLVVGAVLVEPLVLGRDAGPVLRVDHMFHLVREEFLNLVETDAVNLGELFGAGDQFVALDRPAPVADLA